MHILCFICMLKKIHPVQLDLQILNYNLLGWPQNNLVSSSITFYFLIETLKIIVCLL